MKQTLLDLWYGNIHPSSNATNKSSEISELLGYLDRHYTCLETLLDIEGKNTLEKFNDCHIEIQSITRENAFIEGFSLATKLLIEAIDN